MGTTFKFIQTDFREELKNAYDLEDYYVWGTPLRKLIENTLETLPTYDGFACSDYHIICAPNAGSAYAFHDYPIEEYDTEVDLGQISAYVVIPEFQIMAYEIGWGGDLQTAPATFENPIAALLVHEICHLCHTPYEEDPNAHSLSDDDFDIVAHSGLWLQLATEAEQTFGFTLIGRREIELPLEAQGTKPLWDMFYDAWLPHIDQTQIAKDIFIPYWETGEDENPV